jgi:hypothetical protein
MNVGQMAPRHDGAISEKLWMKRLLAVAIGICVVGSIWAQGSFTIVRPADGSKVREKVRVLIPKNSLDAGSYVGIFLNGQFVEAVVPPVDTTNANYRVYTLDTKGRKIADGEVKLELVKYEGGDTPRIMDRSSITVTVGNQMNIKVPAGGIKLRYGFTQGQQLTYRIQEIETVSTMTGASNLNNGRPAQLPASELSHRILYAVDNTYSNGDALIRMQNIPNKGKDYSILAVLGEPEPRQVFDYQMQPVYMRINKTGRPLFGAVPEYFGFSSGGAVEGGEFVYGSWPLPVLPEKAVAPGSSWASAYELPLAVDPGDAHLLNMVTQPFPARGEFVGVEWEMGHPCAKLRNSIAEGTRSFAGQQLEKAGKAFADDKVALDETIYFALDTHKILKLVRSITIDRKVQVQDGGGAGGAGGGMRGAGMGNPKAPGGPKGLGGPMGSPGLGGPGDDGFYVPGRQRMLPRPPEKGQGQGQGAPQIGGQGARQGGGGGSAPRTQYIRQSFQQIFILEQ